MLRCAVIPNRDGVWFPVESYRVLNRREMIE